MTTYNSIENGLIDAESVLTDQLFTRLRDNPEAIAEGAVEAPRYAAASFSPTIETKTLISSQDTTNISASDGVIIDNLEGYPSYSLEVLFYDLSANTAPQLNLQTGENNSFADQFNDYQSSQFGGIGSQNYFIDGGSLPYIYVNVLMDSLFLKVKVENLNNTNQPSTILSTYFTSQNAVNLSGPYVSKLKGKRTSNESENQIKFFWQNISLSCAFKLYGHSI